MRKSKIKKGLESVLEIIFNNSREYCNNLFTLAKSFNVYISCKYMFIYLGEKEFLFHFMQIDVCFSFEGKDGRY